MTDGGVFLLSETLQPTREPDKSEIFGRVCLCIQLKYLSLKFNDYSVFLKYIHLDMSSLIFEMC